MIDSQEPHSPASAVGVLPQSAIGRLEASAGTRVAVRWFLVLLAVPLLTAGGALARFYVPGFAVPFTLQTMVVVLSGAWLGAGLGAASMGAYLLYGALGVPLFTQGEASGWHYLFAGITAGYLLSFPLASFATARLLSRERIRRSRVGRFGAFLAGTLVVLTGGTLWGLLAVEPLPERALFQLFLVFVPFAIVKAACATLCYRPRSRL